MYAVEGSVKPKTSQGRATDLNYLLQAVHVTHVSFVMIKYSTERAQSDVTAIKVDRKGNDKTSKHLTWLYHI